MTTELQQYLDAGGRPEDVPGFGLICDEYVDAAMGGGKWREVEHWRRWHAENATLPAPSERWQSDERWQRYNRAMVDLLDDEATRRAFWGTMAPGIRAQLEGRIDLAQRPVLMRTDRETVTVCNVCGTHLDDGVERVVLQTRDPRQFTLEDGGLVICLGCITAAALGTIGTPA